MREWIFVGPQQYVLEQRSRATEETTKLLDEWELGYEIKSATDPVFVDEYSRAAFQMAFDLKYEIQTPLPYKTAVLAVGSLNFHRDFFGRCLNITSAGGEAANMACAAFGLERLALAFLAQHGLNAKQWPAPVADNLKTW
jgi:seryl-tRNA synthetase